MGGQVSASAGREQITYSVSGLKQNVKDMAEMLAETTLDGNIVEWELDEKKAFYANDIKDMPSNPLQFIQEKAHVAGYSGKGLGMPLLCPSSKLAQLTPEVIGSFMETHFIPSNMVLAAVGPDHEEVVAAAEASFGSAPSSTAPAPAAKSSYTGGEYREVAEHDVTQFGCAPAAPAGGVVALRQPPNSPRPQCHVQAGFRGRRLV